MADQGNRTCIAFDGCRCLAWGDILDVAKKVKQTLDQGGKPSVLIFDDLTSELVEVDFRGTMKDVLKRLESFTGEGGAPAPPADRDQETQRGRGRPRLGVVSREVTLLPRHWDWLNSQPGGASVALRKLVEEARRVNAGRDKVRRSQEVAYRFMSAMAGDLPGFEEATRALFAGDRERFDFQVASWPPDVRDHAQKLSHEAFPKR
jgi:uncharacterized protein